MKKDQALAMMERLEKAGAICSMHLRPTGLKAQLFGKRYTIQARIAKDAEFVTPLDIANLAAAELAERVVPAIEFSRENQFVVHGGKVTVGW